ncbi:MAG: 2OG-Fe(II) oxygenase family protein [Vampirovibrionales bacterium]|nr:2OG-Fe(II) oxygenase family protein [Vampirovibrionales bacterium]
MFSLHFKTVNSYTPYFKVRLVGETQNLLRVHFGTLLQLPHIDLKKLEKGDRDEEQRFLLGLQNYGAVDLATNTKISTLFCNNLARKLFNYPINLLKTLTFQKYFNNTTDLNHESQRGYIDTFTSKALIPLEQEDLGDANRYKNKAGWHYLDKVWLFGKDTNIFPPNKTGRNKPLPEQINDSFDAFTQIKESLLQVFSKAYGTHAKNLRDVFNHHRSFTSDHLRFLYYPTYNEKKLSTSSSTMFYRHLEHTDRFSFLTLLPASNVAGLEFQHRNEWKRAPELKDDHVLVMTGKQLEIMSGGQFKACPHRVTGTKEEMQTRRFSTAFFIRPNITKKWSNFTNGQPIQFESKPVPPPGWYGLLQNNPNATQADYDDLILKKETEYKIMTSTLAT